MKIFKRIIIVIGCIVAIPLIAALFVPNTYTVSVSETINRPRNEVYDYVRILNNQKDYSIYLMEDPDLKPEIIGQDGTKGVIQRWNSKIDDVGEGEQEITSLSENRMDVEIRFKRPFKGKAKAANIFKAVSENQTIVTSEFYSDESYPLNLPSYVFGRKMMADAQTKNLQNLKKVLEKNI